MTTLDAPKVQHVRRENVHWLWPGRIPFGKLTIIDGDPGLGKSTLSLDLAARISTGSPLPDGTRLEEPLNTIVMSAEDAVADTIRPRLESAGADLGRITAFRGVNEKDGPRPPVLPLDLPKLEALIFEDEARLVVIDPIMAYLSGGIDSHKDSDIRRVLHALSSLAERTGVALVALRHLNKTPGGSAMYRGGGSIAFIGAARAGLLVAPDPSDEQRHILACLKSNLAVKPQSLAYRLTSDLEFDCAHITWDGESALTADQLLNPPRETKSDTAAEFLEDALVNGAVLARELFESAEAEGISKRTLERAKQQMGVEAFRQGENGKIGGGAWWWRIKGASDLERQASINPMATLITAGQRASSNGSDIKDANPGSPGTLTLEEQAAWVSEWNASLSQRDEDDS